MNRTEWLGLGLSALIPALMGSATRGAGEQVIAIDQGSRQ